MSREKTNQGLDEPDVDASVAYLARVLGVESVLFPPSALTAATVVAADPEPLSESTALRVAGPADSVLAFLIPAEHFEGETRALWSKMVQAMKREPMATLLFGAPEARAGEAGDDLWARLTSAPRSAIVVLGETAATRLFGVEEWIAARWLEPRAGFPVLVSHGLDAMLSNPDLKRSAWQHLQMAMKRLS